MRTQSESVSVPQNVRSVRDDIRANNPRLPTIYDRSIQNALVTYAKSTR
jgi:hypothetical protein